MTSNTLPKAETAIPADIQQAANAVYLRQLEERDDTAPFYTAGEFKDVQVGHIARAILAERQRDQWQPIETAPFDGSDILVCITHNLPGDEWETIQWVDWQFPGVGWCVFPKRIDIPFPPTHWMPLPAAPKEEA